MSLVGTCNAAPQAFMVGRPSQAVPPAPATDLAAGGSLLNPNHLLVELKRAIAEQEVDDVAFVRLQPVERDRLQGAEVEAIDVRRVGEFALPLGVFRDR